MREADWPILSFGLRDRARSQGLQRVSFKLLDQRTSGACVGMSIVEMQRNTAHLLMLILHCQFRLTTQVITKCYMAKDRSVVLGIAV
jgi:hypothetical protein